MKTCTVCKEEKSFDNFYPSNTYKDGFYYRCIPCEKLNSRRYYDKYKRKVRERLQFKAYGITPEEVEKLRREQDGMCAICSEKMDDSMGDVDMKTRQVVDHCHTTKKVRGLLCTRCNQAIGLLRDSPAIMQRAINYLTKETK